MLITLRNSPIEKPLAEINREFIVGNNENYNE